jgi:predicted TIM-barrel fold metal-dependent hydrolase
MFDLSKLQKALGRLGAEKLIAGSDSSYIDQGREIRRFDLIPRISEREKALVLGENMRKILGL